jgi:hypothetical protein
MTVFAVGEEGKGKGKAGPPPAAQDDKRRLFSSRLKSVLWSWRSNPKLYRKA